ncbi:rod shape-determining protein MreD [Haemophilus influenzae R3021]|uniref:Rod shape-determining protein MreD n=1 Tax=Haemophilus influenzae R3021 TaxID=375432 RepID=A4N3G0_HAEIF|nr:rod shape-determining protein MreD [Haemophilus influenzae R3021]
MQTRFILQWFTILSFFVIAFVLELAPWPVGFQMLKPAWLVLVLLYWVLAIPNKVSIGWSFFTRINLGFNIRLYIRRSRSRTFYEYVYHCQKLFNSAKFITLVPKFIGCTFRLHYKITYFLS